MRRSAGEGPARSAGEGPARYRGRFAPSPSGRLHFGSLVAAVGSYLDARAQRGEWLLRLEDLDPPRTRAGAADQILTDLESFGLQWDGPVWRQSNRFDRYAAVIEQLRHDGALRQCHCSRSALARLPENESRPAALGDELFHPADCVPAGVDNGPPGHALRLRVPEATVEFDDRSLGRQCIDVQATVGDFVLQRRDRLFAYQLAVVVDDADQGITDVVRGCDLLTSSARQIVLQRRLGLPAVRYLHLPLAVDDRGLKLSKSGGDAPAVTGRDGPAAQLASVLRFLGQNPPAALTGMPLQEAWAWAVAHWRIEGFAGCATRAAPNEANAGTAG